MILSCQNICKAFGNRRYIVTGGQLPYRGPGKRPPSIGINGAGKTTLLRMIVGELELRTPDVVALRQRARPFGYLEPSIRTSTVHQTIYEELISSVKAARTSDMEKRLRCQWSMR